MNKNQRNDSSYYIGLMSGTSLDGVDAVLVDCSDHKIHLLDSLTFPITNELRRVLLKFTHPHWKGSLSNIGTLHQQLGHLFADASNALIKQTSINKNQIRAIGSHGQTLWHQPSGNFPFSMQLGDANVIAEKTGLTAVADFRGRDLAAGGQGAPLVPAFHQAMFRHPTKNRALLNLGGIANVTLLPAEDSNQTTIGYDTGPGNGLIDAWISKHQNTLYDTNGDWARSGTIIPNILEQLLKDYYFSLEPPKSTGKEAFNLSWLDTQLGLSLKDEKPQDIQATLTELTAITVANDVLSAFSDVFPCDELFVCGGGIYNTFLLDRLKHHLSAVNISSTHALGIDPNWMEAMAFAWLAKQTLEGSSGNLPTATGAKGYRVLGAIYSK